MDVDSSQVYASSNVDDWLARFYPLTGPKPGPFPFTSRKTHSIEYRRARMSDLLIFDVLLIRGGIRCPDMLFPPADWLSLRKLLDAIDGSIYDILKRDCLVYILLKWTWDADPKETNPGWNVRYVNDRSIPPQFAALADAYWLLDTGTDLSKAVSILSDTRLNRDYVSKILQALALSSSPGTSDTAPLVVKYVRTAKPLLTEPDDIDLYALSLAQLSFMDAWAYQRSFPEGSNTRERLLAKIVGWCLMPTPKQESLLQLIAFPLSSYEYSSLHSFALPSRFTIFSPPSTVHRHTSHTPSEHVLSSQAISILQDLLCVRAIQSGDYVHAIKLDHQFSSVSPLGSGTPSLAIASQAALAGRDTIDRKLVIQDLLSMLPPAERTLLEDELGKVATGVRAETLSTPRQGASASARRPMKAELNLSASWEDVSATVRSATSSPSLSLSSSAVDAGFARKVTPPPVPTVSRASQPIFPTSTHTSPFASRVSQPSFGHQLPPTPKFTAFGSPIPSTASLSTGKGFVIERARALFPTGVVDGPSPYGKPSPRVSLFVTTGSAKNVPNAFYKPRSAPAARMSLDSGLVQGSSNTVKNAEQDCIAVIRNGKPQGGESNSEDVDMGSGSDVEIVEKNGRDDSSREERAITTDEEADAGAFLTHDKTIADLTLPTRHADGVTDEDDRTGPMLGFSVFSRRQNGNAGEQVSRNEYTCSPRRNCVSPSDEAAKNSSASISSVKTRMCAPPGAFHSEEEGDEDQRDDHQKEEDADDHHDYTSPTTPVQSPHRSSRTGRHSETPSRPSTRSQPKHDTKSAMMISGGTSRPSMRSGRLSTQPNLSQTIPGALIDKDNGQDDADHTDTHPDEDTDMDEQEEDAIVPLPTRSSRRTRSSGFVGASNKSKTSTKQMAPAKAATTATSTKGKARTRPSEVKTPARRSSRLSIASPTSPDHTDAASPTKGRKGTSSRAPIPGSTNRTVATRSSTRRKR